MATAVAHAGAPNSLRLVAGVGLIGVAAWMVLRKTSAPTGTTATAPRATPPPPGSLQVRPIPASIGALPEAQQRQYTAVAQQQLYALHWLSNTNQITGVLDDATVAALRAFVQHDPAVLVRVHAAGPPRQTTAAIDALDTAYQNLLAQRSDAGLNKTP